MSKMQNLQRNLSKPVARASEPMAGGGDFKFRIDDAVPMMDKSDILDYMELSIHDDYYEPHISFEGLEKAAKSSPAHGSALWWKINRLSSSFIPSKRLKSSEFYKFAMNYFMFSNAYLERVKTPLGGALMFKSSPALSTRKAVKNDQYLYLSKNKDKHWFDPGAIYHFLDPSTKNEIYGEPQYLSGLQSVWLNESSTLFRRKYYLNGSHAGYIIYMTDAVNDMKDVEELQDALAKSKGPGNFKNLLMYAPNGKKDGLQVMPLAEATAKDEFFNISKATRADILIAHRISPQLLGSTPENAGGFGDAGTADELAHNTEIVPVQNRMLEINDYFGVEIIKFKEYEGIGKKSAGG